jgi:hypothetical protein
MSWSLVTKNADSISKIWEENSIGWDIRQLIGSALDSVNLDSTQKKTTQLTNLLEKMSPADRQVIEDKIGMKKTTYFDKLKAGLDAEREFLKNIASNDVLDDYMDIDKPTTIQAKEEGVTHFDDYVDLVDDEEAAMQKRIADALAFLNTIN